LVAIEVSVIAGVCRYEVSEPRQTHEPEKGRSGLFANKR